MNPYTEIQRNDLYSLEEYAVQRNAFRESVILHKQNRKLALGDHVVLCFEDRLTMHYQIQEMLRVERIFEKQGIDEELQSYNPLIPGGRNLKATMMIQYKDVSERTEALKNLIGIDKKVWLCVSGFERVYPISNEDLERDTPDKTSAVHFLRFEFSDAMIERLKSGEKLYSGIEHTAYQVNQLEVDAKIRDSLIKDFR